MAGERKKQPPEATELQRQLANQSATQATFVNRFNLIGYDDNTSMLVFGFIGGFPNGDGTSKPYGSAQPALLVHKELLQKLVDSIARNRGIVPSSDAIAEYADKGEFNE